MPDIEVYLPLELQEMILDQLRLDSGQGLAERYEFFKKTLPSCSIVCKAWLKKCRVILFQNIEITSPRQLNRFYALFSSPTSHRIGPYVEEATIRDGDARSPYIHLVLMKSARYFPNLQKLLIYGEESMSFPIFHHIHLYLFHFRRLEYLRIERYSIGFRDLRRVISSFPSLIEVEMTYVAFTTSPDAHYATLPLLKDTAWKLSTIKLRACSINYLGLHFWVAPSLSIRDRAPLTSISPLSVYDVHVLTKLLETGYGGRDVEHVTYERIHEPADDTLIVHCYSWFGGHYTFIFGHLNLPEQTSFSSHSQLKAIVRTFEIDNTRYRNHDWSTVDALVSEIRSSHLSVNINVPRSVKYRKSQPQETREEEMEGIRLKLPWIHRHCNLNIQIPSKPGWHPPRLSELARSNSMPLVPLPTLPRSVHKTIIQFLRAPFDNATLAMCALTSKAWLMESRRIHFKVININERRSPESLRELLIRRETETISEHIVVLHLSGFPGFRINDMFFSIIPVLPNLRSIAILKDQYWEGQYIVFIPKYPFPTSQYRFRLRVLELRGYRIWFTDLRRLMNAYPSLESVRMEHMSISHRNNPLPPVRNSSRSVKTFQLMQSRPIIFPFWLWLSPALFEPNDNITNPDTQRFRKFNTPFLTMPDVFAITQLIRSGFRHARLGQAPSDSLTSMNSYRWEYDAVYGICGTYDWIEPIVIRTILNHHTLTFIVSFPSLHQLKQNLTQPLPLMTTVTHIAHTVHNYKLSLSSY
ncbi:hypothetical protein C8Q75DRAFT_257019 [Abortiporus biennis]|nr:hypothetical protein C8Q75DRAFT_257019 [Abortiporus biennis]